MNIASQSLEDMVRASLLGADLPAWCAVLLGPLDVLRAVSGEAIDQLGRYQQATQRWVLPSGAVVLLRPENDLARVRGYRFTFIGVTSPRFPGLATLDALARHRHDDSTPVRFAQLPHRYMTL